MAVWTDVAGENIIVSMVTYRDMVIVATAHDIYAIKDGVIERLEFVYVDRMDEPAQQSPSLDDEIPY